MLVLHRDAKKSKLKRISYKKYEKINKLAAKLYERLGFEKEDGKYFDFYKSQNSREKEIFDLALIAYDFLISDN